MSAAFAAVGNDIWVSNAEFCDLRGADFDLAVHVHHEISPTPGRCRSFEARRPSDLYIRYVDGNGIATCERYLPGSGSLREPITIRGIASFCQKPGRLLCHCAAGICRGPTMAFLAKVARGCTPWQAMHDIASGMWLGYQQSPQFFNLPITEINWWYWNGKPCR